MPRSGLHFAFLDPYNLEALPFTVISTLATLPRMDILVHVSVLDLKRNLERYIEQEPSPLDTFAPGWRGAVNVKRRQSSIRQELFEYWRALAKDLSMTAAEGVELVTTDDNRGLYWLAFIARNERALEFWEKIRGVGTQRSLFD